MDRGTTFSASVYEGKEKVPREGQWWNTHPFLTTYIMLPLKYNTAS